MNTLLHIRDRSGLRRLLHALGFEAAPAACSGAAPAGARRLSVTSRATVDAFIIELRGPFRIATVTPLCRELRRRNPTRYQLLLLVEPRFARVVLAADMLEDGPRHIVIDPADLRQSDVETIQDLAQPRDPGTAHALHIHRALDRGRLTDRFFHDVRSMREHVSRSWTGIEPAAAADRDALALLLISRLIFLYFLQRNGLLNGDRSYIRNMLSAWLRAPGAGSFLRLPLQDLFFGVLNRRPEHRSARCGALGPLPYLNGGLFERHSVERKWPSADLPDHVTAGVIDNLLEKYRFTTGNALPSAAAHGVDPEMLGRIFEGLMPSLQRSTTATFYTPAPVVQRVVAETFAAHFSDADDASFAALLASTDTTVANRAAGALLERIDRLRILDPACGSGAFLLGALEQLVSLRCSLGECRLDACRNIIGSSLHGVDLLHDAALICSLRLWLTLIPEGGLSEDVPPLPNLDRRIRQGDALIDPLHVSAGYGGRPLDSTAPPELRRIMTALPAAAAAYLSAEPHARAALRRRLDRMEHRLARGWLQAVSARLSWQERELIAQSGDVDLFMQPARHSRHARGRLAEVRSRIRSLRTYSDNLEHARSLPFFSFRVHFAGSADGFDMILSNPPWLRSHHWPSAIGRMLKQQYEVCSAAGGQVDLAMLFLERAVRLLKPGGTLGILLPAKLLRSLYAGGARALLLRDMNIHTVEDHSLDQKSVFHADSFTTAVIARRRSDGVSSPRPVHIRIYRRDGDILAFDADPATLPLHPDDPRSPWLIAPPACAAALRAMERNGTTVPASGLRIRRGLVTHANDVLLVRKVQPRLGDLAFIHSEGYYRGRRTNDRAQFAGVVEASVLRPVLRGTDIRQFAAVPTTHLLWAPCNDSAGTVPPPRLARYLARHAALLDQNGTDRGLLRCTPPREELHRVVWSDLASDLRAVAVPPRLPVAGLQQPVVALNTAYFIPCDSERTALILAAYMNSRPVRAFARAVAERAKDAHFRFFAWTVAMLPLPVSWRAGRAADRIHAISQQAHDSAGISSSLQEELDSIVASELGLSAAALQSIRAFDDWIGGRT